MGAPCSAAMDAEPSADSRPAKKPFSQERWASENGAPAGMISIFDGGVIWFTWRSRRLPVCAGSRHHGGGQKRERLRLAMRDASDRLSGLFQRSSARPPL